MTREEAIALAEEIGFSHSGIFKVEDLRFRAEVRDMRRADHGGIRTAGFGHMQKSRRRVLLREEHDHVLELHPVSLKNSKEYIGEFKSVS